MIELVLFASDDLANRVLLSLEESERSPGWYPGHLSFRWVSGPYPSGATLPLEFSAEDLERLRVAIAQVSRGITDGASEIVEWSNEDEDLTLKWRTWQGGTQLCVLCDGTSGFRGELTLAIDQLQVPASQVVTCEELLARAPR